MLLFLIIYVMTVKPAFDDEALFVGIAGALLAGGIIWWRYRTELAQMMSALPPSSPPADATES